MQRVAITKHSAGGSDMHVLRTCQMRANMIGAGADAKRVILADGGGRGHASREDGAVVMMLEQRMWDAATATAAVAVAATALCNAAYVR